MSLVRCMFNLSLSLHAAIAREAEARGVSYSQVVREALEKRYATTRDDIRERDTLWCQALTHTQQPVNGRLVCDSEAVLHWFNAHRKEP